MVVVVVVVVVVVQVISPSPKAIMILFFKEPIMILRIMFVE